MDRSRIRSDGLIKSDTLLDTGAIVVAGVLIVATPLAVDFPEGVKILSDNADALADAVGVAIGLSTGSFGVDAVTEVELELATATEELAPVSSDNKLFEL